MLPLKLMEIHGFFFLVFSLCQCLFIPTEYSLETGWSLRLWTIGNTWEGRQGMKWVDDPKRNLAGDTMRHGFVHGPCSLLQLFIKASELWSSWLVLFLSFHQFANEILKSTGTQLWMAAQSNQRPQSFSP